MFDLSRRFENGLSDARIRAAAAYDPVHCAVDFLDARRRIALYQRACGHQLRALAIAALHDIDTQPRLFQCARLRSLQTFYCRDFIRADIRELFLTRRFGIFTNVHGARAAHADAATELGARHFQFAAQDPKQWSGGIGVHVDRFAVDIQLEHVAPPAYSFVLSGNA